MRELPAIIDRLAAAYETSTLPVIGDPEIRFIIAAGVLIDYIAVYTVLAEDDASRSSTWSSPDRWPPAACMKSSIGWDNLEWISYATACVNSSDDWRMAAPTRTSAKVAVPTVAVRNSATGRSNISPPSSSGRSRTRSRQVDWPAARSARVDGARLGTPRRR